MVQLDRNHADYFKHKGLALAFSERKVKWATSACLTLQLQWDNQEAAVPIHRWGSRREPLPDRSGPVALQPCGPETAGQWGCGSHCTHSPWSGPMPPAPVPGEGFFYLSSTFQISWGGSRGLNGIQQPTGRASECDTSSLPARKAGNVLNAQTVSSIPPIFYLQTTLKLLIYCSIFSHFLWPCGFFLL